MIAAVEAMMGFSAAAANLYDAVFYASDMFEIPRGMTTPERVDWISRYLSSTKAGGVLG